MNSPLEPMPRTVPRREVASESMGAIFAVVAIAAIMIVGLSFVYVYMQAPSQGIGVIGEATLPDLTPQPSN